MTDKSPTLEEWRRLYDAAVRMKEMAPWQWMTEVDVFGVENPETDELGFASVMGAGGEYHALAVYLGTKGLYDLWQMQQQDPTMSPERILEIPQLHASFENRKELEKEDYAVIKKLGLKFRGRNAWPQFRSYRPGHLPWFLEADEVRLLTHALEQLLHVAPRFKENQDLLEPGDDEDYLVRVPYQEGEEMVWEDEVMEIPPPDPIAIDIQIDKRLMREFERVSRQVARVEIDLFMLPTPVQENKNERPYFVYNLLVVEARSGFVIGTDVLPPLPSLEAMWGQVPQHAMQALAKHDIHPRQILVRSTLLRELFKTVFSQYGVEIKQSRSLRSLDEAKNELLHFLR